MTSLAKPLAASEPAPLSFEQWVRQLPWWQQLAYRSARTESLLWLMVLSGLLLWPRLGVPWPQARVTLLLHIVVSFLAFVLVVTPFWLSHRQLLLRSHKPRLRTTGRALEILLLLMLGSGLWLTLIGNRGDLPGRIAHWLHFLATWPFFVLLLVHVWRFSVLRQHGRSLLLIGAVLLAGLGAGKAFAVETSRSLLPSPDGQRLYSANFDVGSVSVIDRASGQRLHERNVGGELQRLALDPATGTLAVTDTTGGRLLLLDVDTLAEKVATDLPGRPFGVVFDAGRDVFWVALFEAAQLVAVEPSGSVRLRLDTAETPRGLALLDDGRLLVTHAMIGEVSVYDTRTAEPTLLRRIALHETSDPDEFVSQGKPRLLDDIAVSPDGREAWLPHVLWNFDHPFQFQSTIFPAVSILSLQAGAERELTDQRKQLFKQINQIEEGSRTRIVSNPHDAEFSTDGKSVVVTLSASEDLMLFDLSRRVAAADQPRERSKRRRGKLDQGGEKVTQIYRHTPGDNPRGLVLLGDDLYVQNAMSLDLSHFRREGNGPFARLALVKERFAETVANDPRAGSLRQGARLFYSGNTDDFPQTPMTGNFWMSCQSCHVDGFNFTNQYLFRDTPLPDKGQNVLIGHRHLDSMIAGNFVSDYVRILRDTQGGMGFDTRFTARNTDPDDPGPEVAVMMADLHRFVRAQENLPAFPGWLRLAPQARMVHEKEWTNSAVCADCHRDIYDQWADSLHRLMGDSNPYYRVAEDVAAAAEGEPFRQWCMSCHHPQGVLSGRSKTDGPMHLFEQGGASLIAARHAGQPDVDEGTGCLFCHRITRIEDMSAHGGGNASYTVDLDRRETYVFEDHDNPALRWLADKQINARPDEHAQSYSQPFYKDPKLCATCHNEVAPGTGAQIVDTYGEWLASPFNAPDNPEQHRTCIDCHMHADIRKIGQPVPGISTDGGRVKSNVVTHQFTGANHHLVGLRNQKLGQMSIDLLRTSADLKVSCDDSGRLQVRIENVGAGHAIPTGVADLREIWLELTVRDAAGQTLLQSGHVRPDGSVPEDSRFFRKVFGDQDGKPVGLEFWRFARLLQDTRIPPGGFRDEVYELPADSTGPLDVTVRLLFRIYPQAITDVVRQRFPELPSPDIVEMKRQQVTLR